jgi:hypothetical protein
MFLPFRSQKAVASFVHPLDPAPRTAILVPGFRSTRSFRVFPHGWDDAARTFAPASVAGTLDQLLSLADEGVSLTHAVICLSWHRKDLLTPSQRAFLWDAFGVPVFEQYLGTDNVLLAFECDAHAALHATPAYTGPTFKQFQCPCGTGLSTCFAPQGGLALRPAV